MELLGMVGHNLAGSAIVYLVASAAIAASVAPDTVIARTIETHLWIQLVKIPYHHVIQVQFLVHLDHLVLQVRQFVILLPLHVDLS
jgi:hypothetical protein